VHNHRQTETGAGTHNAGGVSPGGNTFAAVTGAVWHLWRRCRRDDVVTERSIRFALWNNEETGFQGATAVLESAAVHAVLSAARDDIPITATDFNSDRYLEWV
jgi:Zn-dependent M28 family amino/carboxypeptidase